MSMQSVLLTAALHYILSPSSLSPLSPLSPLLQLVCCLPRLPTPSPSFCLSNTISACYPPFVSSCSTDTVRTCGPPLSSPLLTPPHPPTLCRVLPPSIPILCLLSCLRGLARVCGPQLPTEPPSLPLLSLLSLSLCVVQSHRVSPSICISHLPPSISAFLRVVRLSLLVSPPSFSVS